VENRAGAGGNIGVDAIAKAAPDGYTMGVSAGGAIAINVSLFRRLPYDPRRDHEPIAQVARTANILVVSAQSPIRTLPELIAAARARPGQLSYGTTGVGSDDHLAALAFQRATGTELLHVPFNGAAQVRNAVLGRTVDLAAMNMGEGINDFRNGMLRPLGQMSAARWTNAQDVPTFRDQGIDLVDGSLRGLAAPAGTPQPVLSRLAGVVKAVMEHPEFLASANQQQLPLRFLDPDQHRAVLTAMNDTYTRMWREHPWRD
jgi:tripartite-type tricarboxylate transporter receptor subunit TctC